MGRLGVHVNAWTAEAKESVQRTWPGVLKVLSSAVDVPLLTEWRQHRPDGILVYREWFGDNRLDRVVDRVAQLLAGVSPISHLVNYVETPWNETHQSGPGLTQYAAASVDACNMLHACGHKVIVGNFSVGWPKLTELPAFFPALRAGDAFGLAGYSAPSLWDNPTGRALYYRQIWAAIRSECPKPFVLRECGIDWGVVDGVLEGWRARGGIAAQDYALQWIWFKTEMERDPYVLGAVIYCCGTLDPRWESFNVAGVPEIEALVTGGSMKLSEQYPVAYAEWVAAGGVEDNLKDHLLGISALPSDNAAMRHLISQTRAKCSQLQGVLAQRPYRDQGLAYVAQIRQSLMLLEAIVPPA